MSSSLPLSERSSTQTVLELSVSAAQKSSFAHRYFVTHLCRGLDSWQEGVKQDVKQGSDHWPLFCCFVRRKASHLHPPQCPMGRHSQRAVNAQELKKSNFPKCLLCHTLKLHRKNNIIVKAGGVSGRAGLGTPLTATNFFFVIIKFIAGDATAALCEHYQIAAASSSSFKFSALPHSGTM